MRALRLSIREGLGPITGTFTPPGLAIAGLTPANPQFGKAYSGNAASITGSAASAELVSGTLPDGMSLTVVGANVVLTGTPTG